MVVDDLYNEFGENWVLMPAVDIQNDWLQYLRNTEESNVKFALKEEFVGRPGDGGEGDAEVAEPIHVRPVKKRRVSGSDDKSTVNGEGEAASGTGLSEVLNNRLKRLS